MGHLLFLDSLRDKLLCFFVAFLFFSVFFSGVVSAGSFAAGPGKIYYNNLLKSGYAETEIYLNNPESMPVDVEIFASGDVSDWLFFYPQAIRMDAQETVSSVAIIKPPIYVPNGQYSGAIEIISRPVRSENTTAQYGLSIETAITLWVFAEVVDNQIVGYSVSDVSLSSVERGYNVPLLLSGKNIGNVEVAPKIHADIYDENMNLINSVNILGTKVMPTAKNTETVYLPTETLPLGQYWVNVSVSVSDAVAYTKLYTFDIMEFGALRRTGLLKHVVASNVWAEPDEIITIYAVFENTGQLPLKAKFKAEVFFEDKLIETLESDERSVAVGETVNLTTYYNPNMQGRHFVEGYVYYSGKTTYRKGTVINVFSTGKKSAFFEGHTYFIYTTILLLLLFFLKRIRGAFSNRSVSYESVTGKYEGIENTIERLTRKTKKLKRKIEHKNNLRRYG
ncbi:MAG: hypothetical protein KAI53_00295 [Candidatus Aenigmarchaeota archaeon]|nr:hypothetical protein [Candidatus Aenigmarchaeota archaeon]